VKAKDVGYHDALSAKMEALSVGKENQQPPGNSKPSAMVDRIKMYYCWLHGSGFSDKHTSSHSCLNKKNSHQDDATVKARKGGSTYINVGNTRTRAE
jgi:hypothetical protein